MKEIEELKLTDDEIMDASENGIGYCKACGAERYGCEPDAENYTCEDCGAAAVDGIDNWLCSGRVKIMRDFSITEA